MPLHLIKLCVGCESIKDLKGWVAERMATAKKKGLPLHHIHVTRMTPKRDEELLADVIAPYSPTEQFAGAPLQPPSLKAFDGRVFLLGTETRFTDGVGAAEFLRSGSCHFALIDARNERSFVQRADALGLRYALMQRIEGFNISNGKPVDYKSYVNYRFRSRNEVAGTNLQFLARFKTGADEVIKGHQTLKRVYGIASLGVGGKFLNGDEKRRWKAETGNASMRNCRPSMPGRRGRRNRPNFRPT